MTRKNISRKLIAYAAALCTMTVLCGMPAAAFASDTGVTKEETVYVVTDSTGAQQDVIVSDHLMNRSSAKTIADETTLADIENVKGEETFKQKGTSLTWNAEGNSIYYQGRTDDNAVIFWNQIGDVADAKRTFSVSGHVQYPRMCFLVTEVLLP